MNSVGFGTSPLSIVHWYRICETTHLAGAVGASENIGNHCCNWREVLHDSARPRSLCVVAPRRIAPPKCDPILRNPEHDPVRFGQHDPSDGCGPLYSLLVVHKKVSKLKGQAMKLTLECTSRSVDFKDLDENLQIFFWGDSTSPPEKVGQTRREAIILQRGLT